MVTLVATIWISSWSQNKRFDDLHKRFDDLRSDFGQRFEDVDRRIEEINRDMHRRFGEVIARLDRIEHKRDDHEQRIVRLEVRTSPILR